MIRFFKTPWLTRLLYPSFTWRIQSHDTIYLTFDDGPDPKVTPWVLEELKKVGAKATFFCLGKNIEENLSLSKNLISDGHVIANHTHHHLKGWKTQTKKYLMDIYRCDREIAKVSSVNKLFRPPYGRISRRQINQLKNKKVTMWSHLSWDFDENLDIAKSIRKLKRAQPGSILLFHDSEKAFLNLKEILPEVLKHFDRRGFKFKALS